METFTITDSGLGVNVIDSSPSNNDDHNTYDEMSSKEEKQRLNEEIVTRESTSLSPETENVTMTLQSFKTSTPNNSIIAIPCVDVKTCCLGEKELSLSPIIKQDISPLKNVYSKSPLVQKDINGGQNIGEKPEQLKRTAPDKRLNHQFYVDLSALPEVSNKSDSSDEKKRIFSMFIGLENKSKTTKMPVRLSSSQRARPANWSNSVLSPSLPPDSPLTADFERVELLCDNSKISLRDIINIVRKKIPGRDTTKRSPKELKEYPTKDVSISKFVKLSRSIPDDAWHESGENIVIEKVMSSFRSENALSLDRLFPNLKNELTLSPLRLGTSGMSGTSITPGNTDDRADISNISSMENSYQYSAAGNSTTEDTSHISNIVNNYQSRLGEDLLRMFVEEIAPDIIIQTADKSIKAHKCILSSRCEYFAGILSGRTIVDNYTTISLVRFSYNVVNFTLRHIYSGMADIPEDVNIRELTMLTDMLGLEGLKEAITYNLKGRWCHYFHNPCPGCTEGVIDTFMLSLLYGLEDLLRKCVRWITKHFREVWPTEKFGKLDCILIERCYREHVINFNIENIFQVVCGCGIIMATLEQCAEDWAEVVNALCKRVLKAAARYAAPRLEAVVRALAAEERPPPAAGALSLAAFVAAAAERAPHTEASPTYAFLRERAATARGSGDFLRAHADLWLRNCEAVLARSAPVFHELPAELRARLGMVGRDKSRARTFVPQQDRPPGPRRDHRPYGPCRDHRVDLDAVRASFIPYSQRPQPMVPGSKGAQAPSSKRPQVRMTKAQEKRANFNMNKVAAPQRRRENEARLGMEYTNVKPRYLKTREPVRPASKLASSSESSGAAASRPRTADSAADSRADSLTVDKYATYIKTKDKSITNTKDVERPGPEQLIPTTCASQLHRTACSAPNMKNTRIPVPMTYKKREEPSVPKEIQKRKVTNNTASALPPCNKLVNKGVNSAKVVPKILKRSNNNRCATRQNGQTGNCRQNLPQPPQSPQPPADIPVMNRSRTFHIDDPEFCQEPSNDATK